MTKQETEELVAKESSKIRASIFDTFIPKAELQVDVVSDEKIITPNEVCAYFPDQNKIRIVFTESEIDNDYAMNGSVLMQQEPAWKVYLRHEIIHEYQFKCVKIVSNEGKKLMQTARCRFPGNGHDETFYTAICECAPQLGMTPQKLLESI